MVQAQASDTLGPGAPVIGQRAAAECRGAFWIAAIAVAACVALLTAWELFAFGWHPAREEAAAFGPYYLVRMAASALAGGVLVWLLARSREAGASAASRIGPVASAGILVSLTVSAAFVAVFIAEPATFHLWAGEDRAIEWISALLLFACSGLFLACAAPLRRAWARLDLFFCLALSGLFFLIAMEEISWMQRVLGFGTPEAIAERNWQAEFNLHNFQTDLAELVYYSGTGLFLILLPLAREALPSWKPFARFGHFIPGRATAGAAAPLMIFTYGQWNLLPIQLIWFASLFALLSFARTSRSSFERLLFISLAVAILLGEAVFLAMGHTMLDIPDATEFKELFISIGLACYAFGFWNSARKSAGRLQA